MSTYQCWCFLYFGYSNLTTASNCLTSQVCATSISLHSSDDVTQPVCVALHSTFFLRILIQCLNSGTEGRDCDHISHLVGYWVGDILDSQEEVCVFSHCGLTFVLFRSNFHFTTKKYTLYLFIKFLKKSSNSGCVFFCVYIHLQPVPYW